jgi:ABC-2 type transport system ATP-binding protein
MEDDRKFAVVTKGLRKEYEDVVAVEDLSLRIPTGRIYGLIGPNGSGKTTVIRMLMGLVSATSGTAEVLGQEMPIKVTGRRVSYMPQELALYTDLTVHENVQLFAELYGMGKRELETRSEIILELVGLTASKHRLVGHLSGGMQHRASLACALINDPDLVFLDEPTVGVDPELRWGFWEHFNMLKGRGKTIVLTTHYMDEAVRCDVVGMMHRGRLIAEGGPGDLLRETGRDSLEEAFLEYIRRC